MTERTKRREMENQNVFEDPPARPENKAAQKTKFILPHCSTIRIGRDMFILAATLYVAMSVHNDLTCSISAINVVVEILFIIDIIFNFCITFICKSGQVTFHGRQIHIHYLNTCFTINLLTVLAVDLPIVVNASKMSVVYLLKYVRLLRLVLLLQKINHQSQCSSTFSILLMYAVDVWCMACICYIIVKMHSFN
ncbi:potassium voltage-gated channel subfamily H member 8-like [Melanotaenia boesemani]|uniref:potassium voltage-gated channel subfamily H member 8-like n=1 Tax=Melanotaenia boesemani TaxID=1250792 RepID=UPI001C04746E|nr:potassium voltage-gated channel subfamily H member 8-like [Melanotaenia boesemani]